MQLGHTTQHGVVVGDGERLRHHVARAEPTNLQTDLDWVEAARLRNAARK